MKLRVGFVSNSSTASFVVKTRPTAWDITLKGLGEEDIELYTLAPEKIELLKKCGFVPTTEENPFRKELNTCIGDYEVTPDTDDDSILGFWMTCNHFEVLQFLVANDIPFKASVHYGHYLYSYDPKDEHIYIIQNFGLEYMNRPKDLEELIDNPKEHEWVDLNPLKKIDKKKFLEDYVEEDSIKMMTG